MRRWIIGASFVALLVSGLSLSAYADTAQRGLAISPVRSELKIDAGATASTSVTVTNLSKDPLVISPTVSDFSVTDYTYSNQFSKLQHNWIKPGVATVTIAPGQKQQVTYDIAVPQRATPGGYYFALTMSARVTGGGLPTTIQAVSLLYMTVSGDLVRTSVLQNDSVPWFVTGSDIPYKFDVKDTGNVYFTAYFYGQVHGLFGTSPESGTAHILLPGAPRTISGTVPSPLLPGIYRLTYGYKVDFADFVTTKTAWVLYIPPWSVIALVLLLLVIRWFWQKQRMKRHQA